MKKKKNTPELKAEVRPSVEPAKPGPVALSVRISPSIMAQARRYMEYHGISFNALVAIALGEFFVNQAKKRGE